MFTEKFGDYVSEGDKISCEVDGFTVTATLYDDDDASPPWQRDDGHGPVTDWKSREPNPGERVLNEDRGSYRYYDFDEAVKIAKKNGWDAPPYKTGTTDERANRAAEADFNALKAWCDDEWSYFGIAVTVSRAGVTLTEQYDHALWGIEGNYPNSDNAYFTEVANQYLEQALKAAKDKLAKLCDCQPAPTA